jgi:hypothetical protein
MLRETLKASAVLIKKMLIYWLDTARLPETRAKRTAAIVESAARNERLKQFTLP